MSAKKVQLISNDLELHKKLEATGLFDSVKQDTTLVNIEDPDILVVSDQLIPYNEFLEKYDNGLNIIKHVFYMISSNSTGTNKGVMQVLKAKGVICISPRLTPMQIVEKICSEAGLTIIANKNIAVFLGTDSKVGTTMTAQAVAETMAKCTKGKVALLFLNGQPSTEYIKDAKDNLSGIESIKVKVINKILSETELMSAFIKQDDLYIMPGTSTLIDVRYFGNEHIENLIQLTSKNFDVVIIDAGHKVFNGMTIGSLNSTQHKYLVTTQQVAPLKNYERTCNQVFSELDIKPTDFLLVVNKFINLPELYSAAHLANLYKTSLIGTIPHVDYGWQAERDECTLLAYDAANYNKQIIEISKIIARQIGIEFSIPDDAKKGILKKIFG